MTGALTIRQTLALPWRPILGRHRTSECSHATSGTVADFLVDTDVFVAHLRGAREFDPRSHRVSYSVVTRAELFAGNSATEVVSILLALFANSTWDERSQREPADCGGRRGSGFLTR